MLAATALEHDVPLLHNDRDFDSIASLGGLKLHQMKKQSASTVRPVRGGRRVR